MPYKDPEKRKAYNKEWHQKNKEKNREKRKEYMKEWNENNKEEQNKKSREYYQTHKEEQNKKSRKYNQTPQGKKSNRISKWRERGIIFSDYDLLYDIYLSTTHCHFCKCLLNQCGSSRKCVDHNHDIHDNENVRGILCQVCNTKGVLD